MQEWTRRTLGLLRLAAVLAVAGGLAGFGGPTAAQDEDAERASVTFTELNDSGITGTAELAARGERTEVTIRAEGALGDHPTHIHVGNCDDLDPNPKYPLNDVELTTTELTGLSDTVIDVPLDELLENDHLILVHKAADEIGTYYACGNIVAGRLTGAAAEGGSRAGGPLGNTGSGTASGSGGATPIAALGGLAVAVAAVALALRRRQPHAR